MTSATIQRAGAPTASDNLRASSSIGGLKSMPTTSSAPRFHSDKSVSAAGALQVHGAAAAAAQVADECLLDGKQVAPARPDQLDRLGQPALIVFRGLVPCGAVRAMHPGHVRQLGVGGRADVVCLGGGSCM